jgi:hypothetical protein
MNKDAKMLVEAYEMVLESKYINKKFARRYNKVTSELLKAEPGSKEYAALKSERDDLVSILKDHGKTPSDLDAFFVKKEATQTEEPQMSRDEQATFNQYGDSSDNFSDVSSEGDSKIIKADFKAPDTSRYLPGAKVTAPVSTPEVPAVAVGA